MPKYFVKHSYATLLNVGIHFRCFPVNLTNFFRTAFLQRTSGGLLWRILCRIEVKVNKQNQQVFWKITYYKSQKFLERACNRVPFLSSCRPKACNFTETGLYHRCFPGDVTKFFNTISKRNHASRSSWITLVFPFFRACNFVEQFPISVFNFDNVFTVMAILLCYGINCQSAFLKILKLPR